MVYTIYASFVFLLSCLVVVPTLMILSQRPAWHHRALSLHEVWARVYFRFVFIKVIIEGQENLSKSSQYIFCCNHFSYVDIPAFCLLNGAKFIGKSSLTKIPFFGYFFKKMHIPVNRSSARSRGESVRKSKRALDEGFNLCFFPEGGIVVKHEDQPKMAPFKDGAFRLAVEKNLPIVPVIMPNNRLIMPDKKPFRIYRNTCKIKVLKPIWPDIGNPDEVQRLKALVFELIQNELLRDEPDKVRAVN